MSTANEATFTADLLKIMQRHRYAGVPGRLAKIIRTAAQEGDAQTLEDYLPRAVTLMVSRTRKSER